MSANEFNAALLDNRATGGTLVYFAGWLPDAKRKMGEDDIGELHLVAKMAMEAQTKKQVCLTQKCLRRGDERSAPIYEYRATVRRPRD